MKRFGFKKRDMVSQQALYYRLAVNYRCAVVPGQTMDLDAEVFVKGDPFTAYIENNCLMQQFFFYVPYRLLWDDWPQFIARDSDYAGTFPTTTTDWKTVQDVAATKTIGNTHSSMARRAFKLIYNQYFGTNHVSTDTWYADVNLDTDTSNKRTRSTDQLCASLRFEDGIDNPTFDATTNPIDLNSFRFWYRDSIGRRKAQMTGDKYVDAMARLGVSLDWRVQMAPEFLAKHSVISPPRSTTVSSGANAGAQVTRFEEVFKCGFKNKRFAEHGLVLGVSLLRPVIMNAEYGHPFDGNLTTIYDFWNGDDPGTTDKFNEKLVSSASTDDVYGERHVGMLKGQNLSGGYTKSYAFQETPASGESGLFPPGNYSSARLGELDLDYSVFGVFQARGATPIPPKNY